MDEKQKNQERSIDEFTEAGDIGDEQMPAGGKQKTDKASWNMAADKADRDNEHRDHRQERYKPGAGM